MKKVVSLLLIVAAVLCIVPLYAFAAYENIHVNTGDMASDIIAVGQTQIGYCEGNNSSQMDGTVAGSGDYTKYGQWYGLCPAAWCAMFVSWCANQASIPTTIIPKFANCDTGMKWFINNGVWQDGAYYDGDYTPKVGDIAFYGYKDGDEVDSTHVGIVYKVDSVNIYSLEGNSSAKVQTVSYSLDSPYVLGYGTPNYTSDPTPVSKEIGIYKVTGAGALNVRTGPSTDYNRLGYIEEGTYVQITQVANDHWGQFMYGNQAGWISLAYCSRIYTVRFNSSGGFGSPSTQDKIENEALKLPTTTPTKTGYTFVGWSTKQDAAKAEYSAGDNFYLNADTTLYAVWTQENHFTDISSSAWYSQSVIWCYNHKYMVGTTSDTFEPASYLTRAMAVQTIANMNGVNTSSYTSKFSDVASGSWYAHAVGWAYSAKVVSGVGNGLFAPEQNVTRQDFMVMLYNYGRGYCNVRDWSGLTITGFSDSSAVADYAVTAVAWCTYKGIVSGTSVGIISPKNTITRAEAATMLMNFYNYIYG